MLCLQVRIHAVQIFTRHLHSPFGSLAYTSSTVALLRCRQSPAAAWCSASMAPQRAVQTRASSANGSGGLASVAEASHQPLAAGEKRHVLSVFVADEPGLIHQVSHVFTQAGE